jgi:hypothetical protein
VYSPSPIALIRGSVASQFVRTSYIPIYMNIDCYIYIYVCAAVSTQKTGKNASVLDRLVSMIFSDGFVFLNFYGFMLKQYVNSEFIELHWSIQPGVSDGCLEFFSKVGAARDHIDLVKRRWLGVDHCSIFGVCQVQLRFRADRLYDFIHRGMMKIDGDKLYVYTCLVSGSDMYSLIVDRDGSVPASISTPPDLAMSGPNDLNLYGGFLKKSVDCVDWSRGIHWNMQPGAYGRITLHEEPTQTASKYDYYQRSFTGLGPAIVQVVLTISAHAIAMIMSTGALVKGKKAGTWYWYVNIYGVAHTDHDELAYTATVYTT